MSLAVSRANVNNGCPQVTEEISRYRSRPDEAPHIVPSVKSPLRTNCQPRVPGAPTTRMLVGLTGVPGAIFTAPGACTVQVTNCCARNFPTAAKDR